MKKDLSRTLKTLIRNQTTSAEGVSNIHGTPVMIPTTQTIEGQSEWRVNVLKGESSFLSPSEVISRITTTSEHQTLTIKATSGQVFYATSSASTVLFSTVVSVPKAFSFTIEALGLNTTVGVYIGDSLIRKGSGRVTTTINVPAGLVALNVVFAGSASDLAVILPKDLITSYSLYVPPTPKWRSPIPIETDYIDPHTGNTGNALYWYDQAMAGGWGIYKVEPLSFGMITSSSFDDGKLFISTNYIDSGTMPSIPSIAYTPDVDSGTVLGVLTSGIVSMDVESGVAGLFVNVQANNSQFHGNDDLLSGTLQILKYTHLHEYLRTGASTTHLYIDTNVEAGQDYSYTLDSFSAFDRSLRSAKSTIQIVTAGDTTPPNNINITQYEISNQVAYVSYTTPTDEDYLGVHVYYDNVFSGTVDSVLIDYGNPDAEDSLSFRLIDSGSYYFAAFDKVGNEQEPLTSPSIVWNGTSGAIIANQPPVISIEKIASAALRGLGEDPFTRFRYRLDASDPDTPHDDLTLYYMRLQDSGAWQEVAGTSLPIDVDIERQNYDTWVRVKATDGVLMSDELTFVCDFDTRPEISSVYGRYLHDSGAVLVNGAVDDDAIAVEWYISDDFTGPTGSDPTSSDPDIANPGNLKSIKTFNFTFGLEDGEKKVAVLTPFAGVAVDLSSGIGDPGPQYIQEFVREPRTLVSITDRNQSGAVQRIDSTISLSAIPETANIYKKVDFVDYGTISSATASTLTDSSKTWSTDRWNTYYEVYIETGNAKGQARTITDTTTTVLSVSPDFSPTPTSGTYRIREKYRYYSINGTATGGTTTKLEDTTQSWQANLFQGKLLTMLTGDNVGQTSFIASGIATEQYLSSAMSNPIAADDQYKIDGSITISKNPNKDKILYFYADVPNIAREEERSLILDTDYIPEIGSLSVTEPTTGILKISVSDLDDDVKTWTAYAKKGGWPWLSISGAFDSDYLRFTETKNIQTISFDVSSGDWYVFAVPYDSYNNQGPYLAQAYSIVDSGISSPAITSTWVGLEGTYYNRVFFQHNSVAEKDSGTNCYIVVTAYRTDLPPETESYVDGAGPDDDRQCWQDSVKGDPYLNEDAVTEDENITGQGSIVHEIDRSGTIWTTWKYTIDLYEDEEWVDRYIVQHSDYYATDEEGG